MAKPSQRAYCRVTMGGTVLLSSHYQGHRAPVVTSHTICSLCRETPEGKAAAELLPMAMLWKEVVVTR